MNQVVGGNTPITAVYAGDVMIFPTTGSEFEFPEDAFEFSVTRDGDVTLNLPNPDVNGTIASATWLDGGTTGPTSMTITRTNTVVVNVPDGYENTGETVSGTVTATQVASTRPFVETNDPTFVAFTSITMNGRITDNGGYPILNSGFFYIEGSIQSVNTIVNANNYQHDGGDGFISEAITVNEGSVYSYVAAAQNQLGWSYGEAVIQDIPEALATAEYQLYPDGQPTGGTYDEDETDFGEWSDWGGATAIQPSPQSDNPTSAICGTSNPTCPISRSRSNVAGFSGATQKQEYVCEIQMDGAGTPTCSDMNGDGQPDPVGTTVPGPTLTGQIRYEVVIETQPLNVTNDAYIPPPVLGCTNPGATNYNSAATQDDGSCEFPAIPGCTNPNASNYNPDATADDGSCEFIFPGCTNPQAENYDPDATVDNGTCIVLPVFDSSYITVSECQLAQSGSSGYAATNYGETTALVGTYSANNNAADTSVSVTFEITIPIPDGFKNEGTPMPYEFTTTCPQPGTGVIPMFVDDSAQVIFLPGFVPATYTAGDGDFIDVPGDQGENYNVVAPSTTAGSAITGSSGFGAGVHSLLNGGRLHTFTISGSPETYSFTVRSIGAPSGGGSGGFNPFAP